MSNGAKETVDLFSLHSVQKQTRLDLFTDISGRIQYSVDLLGDAAYPLMKSSNSVGSNPPLKFFQDVLPRPRAFFTTSERLVYCLHDTFRSEDMESRSGIISLHGMSPFYLELTLHDLASAEVHKERVKILKEEWRVELPDYKFDTVGSYMLTIDSVWDASSCKQEVDKLGFTSIIVDVAESAAIMPMERTGDHCVGDLLKFQLEGCVAFNVLAALTFRCVHRNPPWQIGYLLTQSENVCVHTDTAPSSDTPSMANTK